MFIETCLAVWIRFRDAIDLFLRGKSFVNSNVEGRGEGSLLTTDGKSKGDWVCFRVRGLSWRSDILTFLDERHRCKLSATKIRSWMPLSLYI